MLEDEITEFYTLIQEQNLTEEEANLLSSYMSKTKAMIISAKNIKDVVPNIRQIDESEDAVAHEVLEQLQQFASGKIADLKNHVSDMEAQIPVSEWQNEFELFYNNTIDNLYKSIKPSTKRDIPASTITNAIKKTVSSLEGLTRAVSNDS